MSAQHQIGALSHQKLRQRLLIAVLRVLIFHAPVDHHRNQIGVQRPGGGQVGLHQGLVWLREGGVVVQIKQIGGIHGI